jgi:UDP-galactopyranose mutase
LYSAVFCEHAIRAGKTCLVVEKRDHIGGNVYTKEVEGINVHVYGPHIFHTSNKEVWDYVNRFAKFNNFVNRMKANYKGTLYSLPFNMYTFEKLWGVKTEAEVHEIIERQRSYLKGKEPENLEEQAISLVGKDVYETLVKGYTEKQWGRPCTELPSFIIRRLPLRFIYEDNYYNDTYQGIPIGGYTQMFDKMFAGATVVTGKDYFDFIKETKDTFGKTIYTGKVDEFFGYRFGKLEYRSLRFETEVLDQKEFQCTAVVTYTEKEIPFTRIVEHKHFEFGDQPKTVITREYPADFKDGMEAYYPINDERNTKLAEQYNEIKSERPDVIFGGRLGEYKYYDMCKVIESAFSLCEKEHVK